MGLMASEGVEFARVPLHDRNVARSAEVGQEVVVDHVALGSSFELREQLLRVEYATFEGESSASMADGSTT